MNMEDRSYYIGEVAKSLGVSQRTIRYYEELGFIQPGRTEGHFRLYAESQVNRLKIILHLKNLGMSLDEIRALVKIGTQGSIHDISPTLRDALVSRKKEFELKLEQYREGVKEMEGALSLIEHCMNCHKKTDQETCHHCIDEHKDELPPLVRVLF
jgi:MerR family Zn(II)-responsive transcriptional regulator of zntA